MTKARRQAGEPQLAGILTGSVLGFLPVWQTSAIDWQAFTPFAAWLVEVARPRTLVELGVYRGDSYCAMCQAIAEHETGTQAFGIDTWAGDEHVGRYGTEVLDTLRDHHDPRYGHFSRLLRMTFDEALDQFEDGSVDLLHIDGYHTYEAVRHDFESWRAKLSGRAIVLLHDTAVRERGFGVWRLWEEIAAGLPGRHLHLPYSNGLGVAVFDEAPPAALRHLCEAPAGEAALYVQMFQALGARVVAEAKIRYWKAQAEHTASTLAAERAAFAGTLTASFDRNLAVIDGRLAVFERDLAAVDGRLAVFDQNLAAIDGRLAAFEGNLAAGDERRAGLEDSLAALQGRLAAFDGKHAAQDKEIHDTRQMLDRLLTHPIFRYNSI